MLSKKIACGLHNGTMKICLALACLLSNLSDCDKQSCLEQTQKATDAELWDVFLETQTALLFPGELNWFKKCATWREAQTIFDIGSGNGVYLSALSSQFPDKAFHGVEKYAPYVSQAASRLTSPTLHFQEGDAEILDPSLIGLADLVTLRFTLQHLKNPHLALENAWHYLKPGGSLIIIESYDETKKMSRKIPALEEAFRQIAKVQSEKGKGNRAVTMEIMQALETTPLSDLYEIGFTNISFSGALLEESFRLEGAPTRKLLFNQIFLAFNLFERMYHIPIDLSQAYDELKSFSQDETSWIAPGLHFLLLHKKTSISSLDNSMD